MLVFLHTSPVHIATFDGLRDRLAPGLAIRHVVREDLLAAALCQGGINSAVEAQTFSAFSEIVGGGTGALVCTCSTLGPLAEIFDRDSPVPVMRIDRPMADSAVLQASHIAVCAALSTALSSAVALVRSSAADIERPGVTVHEHLFAGAWKFFERGDMEAYHREVARGLRGAALTADLILLAQASMQGAAAYCPELTVPIWSSPETGFRAALALIDHKENI
ncbi:MAG: hypothetical protein EXR08_06075 [Alphaproteobacteria bacterium]|nr:hypothetical protein [Alphaproteobacteria bacterium]